MEVNGIGENNSSEDSTGGNDVGENNNAAALSVSSGGNSDCGQNGTVSKGVVQCRISTVNSTKDRTVNKKESFYDGWGGDWCHREEEASLDLSQMLVK